MRAPGSRSGLLLGSWRSTERKGEGGGLTDDGEVGSREVVDGHRLDRVGRGEAEDPTVEVQLRLERPGDVGLLPEAVALALEHQQGHRQTLGAQRVGHALRLVGWYDLVVRA